MVAPKPITGEELTFLSDLVAVDPESPSGLVYKNPVKNDHKNKPGDVAGKCERSGYWRFRWDNQRRSRSCHALVLELSGRLAPSDKHEPDHIDRNKGNNRLVNLRWATKVVQLRNRQWSATGYRWVRKRRNCFSYQFTDSGGKKRWGGGFATAAEAHAAAVIMREQLGVDG